MRKSPLRALVALSMLTVLGASAQGADDSVWINQGIQDAIKSGKHEYTIPAGTFNLSSPIRIPDGTQNFTLRGEGSNETRFVSDTRISYAIMAGVSPVLHNNWGIANKVNISVGAIADGAMTIKVPSIAGLKVGDHIAIWDDSYVEHSQFPGGDRNMNHAELARIAVLDARNKAIKLDRQAGRSYNANAKIALIDSLVLKDIQIRDMGFDGAITGTNGFNNGIVQLGLSEDVKLMNLDVKKFATRAILVNWCRDVEVSDVSIADGLTPQYAGCAYGVTLCRSRNVLVKNCYVTGSRHGYVSHNGTTDATFEDCVADGDNGNYDTHGCDERRITYSRCTGTGSFNVGNGAWRAGGTNFRVYNCDFGGAFHFGPNTTDIEFRNTTIRCGISLDGPGGSKTNSKLGARFYDCAFKNLPSAGLFWEGGDFGRIEFTRCTIATDASTWGNVLNMKTVSGSLVFTCCQLISNVTRNYVPVWLSSRNLDISFIGCYFLSRYGSVTGVQFAPTYKGTSHLVGNLFYTNGRNATFLTKPASVILAKNASNRVLSGILGGWMGDDGDLTFTIP